MRHVAWWALSLLAAVLIVQALMWWAPAYVRLPFIIVFTLRLGIVDVRSPKPGPPPRRVDVR